ncbi:ribonuclease D [Corynebacterium sp. USCH3]|uniref:ribonuclease D n=1 Tax=Corynebacterium sp. USCH3 TaxID=3024840 RepID=UPI003098BAED
MAEHLSSPRGGVPALSDTLDSVQAAAEALAHGQGPLAVDTERASGFRFNDRAFLVQVRREGSGTHLIDPAAVPAAGELLAPVMDATPWILHAAHSDLPALTSLGWRTPELHDTQIAGRLLGYGQIGLAGMMEELLGVTVAKDKGREDWSARPIPDAMLTYAALDVELLIELHDVAASRLEHLGRTDWYRQECAHVRETWSFPVPEPDWRKLRGLGHVRDPRGLEIVRRLIDTRSSLARTRDVPPEHVLRGSSILDLARQPSRADRQVAGEVSGASRLARSTRGPRLARELTTAFSAAVREALDAAPSSLPARPSSTGGRPDHRTWERDHPLAYRLADGFRHALATVSTDTGIRSEDLLTVSSLRSVAWDVSCALRGDDRSLPAWQAADTADPVGDLEGVLGHALEACRCRRWQTGLLIDAFLPVVAESVS